MISEDKNALRKEAQKRRRRGAEEEVESLLREGGQGFPFGGWNVGWGASLSDGKRSKQEEHNSFHRRRLRNSSGRRRKSTLYERRKKREYTL